MKPLRVHFDQNCINVKGRDPELKRIAELDEEGKIQLVANLRNQLDLGKPEKDGPYRKAARVKLATFEQSEELFRLDASPLDLAGLGPDGLETVHAADVWKAIFPKSPIPLNNGNALDEGQNSLHDIMHIVNAHDSSADVFITRENALINAREKLYALGLRPRIERPSEFLLRFPS